MPARWSVKPAGFATVKQGKWWVKPGEPAAPPPAAGRAPSGGRVSTTSRTGARNSLVPREWVGSEGLIGNWSKPPRLDPTAFETIKSSETGRWWARPRTELTGLTPGQRADVKAFDQTTTSQGSRIDQAFADYVQQSGQNAQQGSAALTGLAGIMGSGYSGDPTGAVLSEAARKEAGAGLAPTIANLNRLPQLAASEGLTAKQAWTTDRLKQRTDLLQGIRETEVKLEGDAADRAVEIRGQELNALGEAAGLRNKIDLAKIDSADRAADRAADIGMNTQDNQTALTTAQLRITAAEKKAAKKAGRKPPTVSDIRQWAKRARAMWDGVPRTITGEDGKSRTEYLQYDPDEIMRDLIAAGATRPRAVRIVRQITGQVNFGKPGSARSRTTASAPTWGW